MSSIFKSGIFWTLFISFIISMVIIFIFPYYFESYESLSYRLLIGFSVFFITLILVLLYVVFFLERTQKVIKSYFENRKKEREEQKIIKDKINDIKTRFKNALKVIKTSSMYSGFRRTKYELPWYLVVGKSAAGKTSLLESSGLEFPLNINFQDQKVVEAGSSESFEWYYAEHAVFIDMPGHYIQQTKNKYDFEVWKNGFLKIFAKKRSSRPINGIVLNISVDTFMEQSEQELIEYANTLRKRFDELSEGFISSIPIYLIITKSDMIPGYTEYFADISDAEKDEVLGMTFDDPNENINTKVLGPKFEALIQRLNASTLDKLQAEWDEAARGKIFLFTTSLSSLFERINTFTDVCFAKTRYRKSLMLRGIYFTSVPKVQEVTTSNLFNAKKSSTKLEKARSSKGLFIKNLLENIILPESDLINKNQKYYSSSIKKQIFAILVAISLISVISFFLIKDFIAHNNLLNEIEENFSKYELVKDELKNTDDLHLVASSLNTMMSIQEKHIKNTSNVFYKINFFNTDDNNMKLINLYRESLKTILLPKIRDIINSEILSNIESYDKTWNMLEAYIMLANIKHRKNSDLKATIAGILKNKYPEDKKLQQDLNQHFENLLAFGYKTIDLNMDTVNIARNMLTKEGYVNITYKGLQSIIKSSIYTDIKFSQVLGSNISAFDGTNTVIPGMYTKKAYERFILVNGKNIVNDILKSNWVIGTDKQLSEEETEKLYSQVITLYFEDYQKYWLAAINDLKVPTKNSTRELIAQLELFSSPESPVIKILKLIKINTEIYSAEELLVIKSESLNSVIDVNKNSKKLLQKKLEVENVDTLTSNLKHLRTTFKPYNLLLDSNYNAGQPLQNLTSKLNGIFEDISAVHSSVDVPQESYNIIKSRARGSSKAMIVKFRSIPVKVSQWYSNILKSNWQFLMSQTNRYLNQEYKKNVLYYYNEHIKGKYPFNRNNQYSSVEITDFFEFFRSGGILDGFFNKYISQFVRVSYNSYSFKRVDGYKVRISNSFMKNILRMKHIQKMMFNSQGTELNANIKIRIQEFGKSLSSLNFVYDTHNITYEHGPIRTYTLHWPTNSSNDLVSFELFDINNKKVLSRTSSGDWALFKLIDQFKIASKSKNTIIFSYNKDSYNFAMRLDSPIAKTFTNYNNPIHVFNLKGRL